MTQANLGSKRICAKCAAKFYDFGVEDPITCPKCGHAWRIAPPKAAVAPASKIKKKVMATAVIDTSDEDLLPDDMIDDEVEIAIDELEPVEEEDVEMISLEEVEEHDEQEGTDVDSDDAEDEMFTMIPDDEKLLDDLDEHMEEEDEEDEEE